MKKIFSLLLFTFFAVVFVNAQTKKIALESHCGKKASFKIDGDGNYGNVDPRTIPQYSPINQDGANPILLAEMHHYEDSLRNVLYEDSMRKADSIRFHKTLSTPPPKPGKRPKAIRGAAMAMKPKKSMVASNQ